jgi:hypothetical protein
MNDMIQRMTIRRDAIMRDRKRIQVLVMNNEYLPHWARENTIDKMIYECMRLNHLIKIETNRLEMQS